MKIMQVIPAIDLRGGRCVRLRQGDFEQETVFGDDPTAMAERWASEGAARIHLVDLDGAKIGSAGQRRGRHRDCATGWCTLPARGWCT